MRRIWLSGPGWMALGGTSVAGLAVLVHPTPAGVGLLASLSVAWLAAVAGAVWATDRVVVARTLPEDVFAGAPAVGRVDARRVWGKVWLEDERLVEPIPLLESSKIPAAWRFPRRGWDVLPEIGVIAEGPFGWVFSRKTHTGTTAPIVVFPAPTGAPAAQSAQETDDFELSPFKHGDSVSSIHWRTTLRSGSIHVSRHTSQTMSRVLRVVVEENASERDLSDACGALVYGSRAGLDVEMEIDGAHFPSGQGYSWRRLALERLALFGPRGAK